MSIEELQEKTDQWIKAYGVRYFDVKTNALILMEEVGEFSRLIARQHGEQSFKSPITDDDVKIQIADEMADIFFVLTCMANQMDINIEEAIEKNFIKKTNRDKERHLNNDKLK